jgi:hypothetical protein
MVDGKKVRPEDGEEVLDLYSEQSACYQNVYENRVVGAHR